MSQTIINGDSAEVLKQFESNSIDAVVTDPPYGIAFLGQDWDSFRATKVARSQVVKNLGAGMRMTTHSENTNYQQWCEQWARECLRVLKPGGWLLAFSAARLYHRIAAGIEDAGFEVRDQIMWIYASGFPKAQDIGRAIQRRQGVEEYEGFVDTTRNVGFGQTDHARVRAGVEWSTKATEVGKVRCTSPEARQWSGWKTALKPAHEPIVMARKPMPGSTIDNVLEHGVGALNIDATRIGDQARFPANVVGEVTGYQKFFYCPKVSRRERHRGTDNNHPTVKPVELMKYLIRLVTPAEAHIIDPFAGSGSTGMACRELGRQFTGIELDPSYCDIARGRISATHEDKAETLFE